ncbi:Methionyl-tRNA formyltransferase [Tilletia horrida]|uniref:methionyl-tRNA formyltransferase n=1 Tax=Tilletia horrida TaxID=155126 RepID=A0AAN6GIM4_9BASI|nr:Methionyl-tRNA formyltransferase [Tilletia horrida]
MLLLLRPSASRTCRAATSLRSSWFSHSAFSSDALTGASETNTAQEKLAAPAPAPYDILFCGTDQFACASLAALHKRRDLWKSLTVLHPPPSKQGWGAGARMMTVAPIQELSEELKIEHVPVPRSGLEGWQPPDSFPISSPSALLLTVSFGHMIPNSILDQLPHPSQALNLHPSLLPQLRGAAPLQWAILKNLQKTGCTVQRLSRGKFDRGRVLGQVEVELREGLDYEDMVRRTKIPGARLLMEVLSDLPAHDANSNEQTGPASFAPKLQREWTRIKWDEWTAEDIFRRHRAMSYMFPMHTDLIPHPSTNFPPANVRLVNIEPITLKKEVAFMVEPDVAPGTARYMRSAGGFVFRCAKNTLLLVRRMQVPGKKSQKAKEWIIGYRDRGDKEGFLRFGDEAAPPGATETKQK